jgi:hypothetical protein
MERLDEIQAYFKETSEYCAYDDAWKRSLT